MSGNIRYVSKSLNHNINHLALNRRVVCSESHTIQGDEKRERAHMRGRWEEVGP